jgi:hypothetical protein
MATPQMAVRTRTALRNLRTLAGRTGELYRERIAESITALRDQIWLQSQFGGSYDKAVEYLQEQWFQDISGFITLHKLLKIYRTIPVAKWRSYNYNLRALELLHDHPEYANGDLPHVSVKAYVRFPSGTKPRTKKQEQERLLKELQALDRRRVRIIAQLRTLGITQPYGPGRRRSA